MGRRLHLVLALAAAGLPACGKPSNDASSSVNQTPTFLPPASADLAFTGNGWSSDPNSGRELFAVNLDGSGLTQLTFCNQGTQPCDTVEATFATDRARVAVRRRFSADEPESLIYVDLARGGTAELVPSSGHVSGLDWSRAADTLAYSAAGTTGVDDLFRTDVIRPTTDNQQNTQDLTCLAPDNAGGIVCDPTVAERRPRIDPTGSTAVYERIAAGQKGEIYVFKTTATQTLVAAAGPGTAPLSGTPYTVGSNADPAYSPDGLSVVFRRLAATGNSGAGSWDLLTARSDGSSEPVLIVSGPAYRGAPDWGAQGIAFAEGDPATSQYSLVVVQPDGSGRHTVLSLGSGFLLSNPRWLK
jgi:Tol biopolymer transport system component